MRKHPSPALEWVGVRERSFADGLLSYVRYEKLAAGPDGQAMEALVLARSRCPLIDSPFAYLGIKDRDPPAIRMLA